MNRGVRRYGDEVVVACPYCGDISGRHHKHLYINVKLDKFFCQICETGGTLERLRNEHPRVLQGLESQGIAAFIEREKKAKLIESHPDLYAHPKQTTFLERCSTLVRPSSTMSTISGFHYLRQRGMQRLDIQDRMCGWSSEWPDRVIFPCFENKRPVYFVGRLFRGRGPKWKNPSKQICKEDGLLPKGEVVYNVDNFPTPGSIIPITEGVFDALALGGVALLGKRATKKQLWKILSLNPSKVLIALDREAKDRAEEIERMLRFVVLTRIIWPPDKFKDWGETLKLTVFKQVELLQKIGLRVVIEKVPVSGLGSEFYAPYVPLYTEKGRDPIEDLDD